MLKSKNAHIKFWGVRGSIAAGASDFGSNTSCVELDLGDQTSIFFDAGSGIRAATSGRSFKKLFIYLSHFHWDHIQGLPFVEALGKMPIQILSGFDDMKSRLSHLFDERFHPVPFKTFEESLDLQVLKESQIVEISGLKLQIAALNHPGKSFGARVESSNQSFVYATDSDYQSLSANASKLFQSCDFAVVDSQYLIEDFEKKSHYGHASYRKAIQTCIDHGVKNCVLFHFDPSYDDAQLRQLEREALDFAQEHSNVTRVQMAKEKESLSFDV